jgi:hypothetical protein
VTATPLPSAPLPDPRAPGPVAWIEVGPPPASVAAARAQQIRRFVLVQTVPGAVVAAWVAGYLVTLLWPTTLTFGSPRWLEIFFAVGVPVGVADYVGFRFFWSSVNRRLLVPVRRVSISGPALWVEPETGESFPLSLRTLWIGRTTLSEGWQTIQWSAGRAARSFVAPPSVISQVKAAQDAYVAAPAPVA